MTAAELPADATASTPLTVVPDATVEPVRVESVVARGDLPRVTNVCAAIVAVLALLGIIGWAFDSEGLRELIPGQAAVKLNIAVAMLLLSVSWLVGRSRVGSALAWLALLIGAATLVEVVFSVSLGIDQLLVDDPANSPHPGRASLITVVCVVVLCVGRLLVTRGRGRLAQGFAAVALIIAAIVLLGYLYDVRELYSARPVTTVSLHTAFDTALLGIATLAAVDGGLLTWTVRGTDAGALLLRRLLPLAVIGLPLIGFLCLLARREDWFDNVATTIAVLVVVVGIIVGLLSWVAARRIERIDSRRERTLLELTDLKEDLERQVTERAGQVQRHGGHIAVLEDRQRIAADLHDIVIQRLFAAGMYLQGANHPGADPDVRDRITTAVEAMDVAIKDLRHSIFELGGGMATPVDITTAVDEIITDATRILGFRPDVIVDDPDFLAETVRDDLLAVLRESLANVARHAAASEADVVIRSGDDGVSLTITDNGKGMGETTHNSGTRNMAERARQRGGDCTWTPVAPSGTRVSWHVPAAL